MFIASMLYQRQDFSSGHGDKHFFFSAVFVLMLVASKISAEPFCIFFTYLVMVYVATRRFVYFGGGILAMIVASLLGQFGCLTMYRHVCRHGRIRLQSLTGRGIRYARLLFAIGTGGWFGLGLGQGLPEKIPVVTKDFVFAAISEELGGVFALCLIMVCVSCFFMIMNVAMKLRDNYYRLTAVGLGTLYALQVFLTIGGVIKFIPSTGVTLPLVSYGGSSLLSTMIVFGIIQGLYIMQFDGRTQKKEQKRRRGRKE